MKRDDFQLMSIDELWGLHEEIGSLLTQRMTAERRELDKLLDTLGLARAWRIFAFANQA
jgi:DNA-binding protein H-NS